MNDFETSSDPRGSIWRRWDPHVHMPGTMLSDGFGAMTVAEALDDLAARTPQIAAAGITDYFTTDGYRAAQLAHEGGAGDGIQYLFPNVEVRLDIPTKSDHGVNLHLLCDSEQVDHLDTFLALLVYRHDNRAYVADHAGLVRLGRAFAQDPDLAESAAKSVGANQFKVSFTQLCELYAQDGWAREHCLIALDGGEKMGSAGLRASGASFASLRQSLERFAHIIFDSNEKQQAFWLGDGVHSANEITELYGGVKPCLHGSDAHTPERLGAPDGNRFTWLKGDTTFETLRMACLAPRTRAVIAPETPAQKVEYGRIEAVTVAEPDWFVNTTVPINPGLVAIIGARGSGKTALADLMAVGAGSDQPFDNRASFIERARPLLDDSSAEVAWSHGETTTGLLGGSQNSDAPNRKVRYLSQQFVDRLCSAEGVSDELLVEIERVVFNAWPEDRRQGATCFRDLLDIHLEAPRSLQRDKLASIAQLAELINDQRVLRDGKPDKERDLAGAIRDLEGIDLRISKLTSAAEVGSVQRHRDVARALDERRQLYQKLDRSLTGLASLKSAVDSARATTLPNWLERIKAEHVAALMTETDWNSFKLIFVGPVDNILAEKVQTTETQMALVLGTFPGTAVNLDTVAVSELDERPVKELEAEVLRLEKLIGLDDQRRKDLTDLQQARAVSQSRVNGLRAEIDLADAAPARIAKLTTRRLGEYAAYFDALLAEENELNLLYAPLATLLEAVGTSVAKLRFSVRRVVDIGAWASEAEEDLIDLRKGPRRGAGVWEELARDELRGAWESGDGAAAAEAIRRFSEAHTGDIRAQCPYVSGDPRIGEWERSVARWLYSASHVTLQYNLEYDGLNIERLSPGSRGIVLLLLYLAVDQAETDPLIIDQPEENLDPESVYSELVTLFREASQRRQIIMVTHNANLVVNTDVDQVIVARRGKLEEGRLPELSYLLGGLESPAVRTAVCEVLEGGAEAFRERARRLRLDVS